MKGFNLIKKDGDVYEVKNEIFKNNFQNKDGSVNAKVLGLYVNEWKCDRVFEREGRFLICKKVDEAQIL